MQRLEAYFEAEGIGNGRFESYRPAAYLLEKHALLRHEVDEATIERAASMFERINALLPSSGIYTEVNGSSTRTLAPTP